MNDRETTVRPAARGQSTLLADLVLDLAVPAMAALFTVGIFLLAVR